MAKTSASLEIPASAERVWQLVGGFGSLPDWLPLVSENSLSEGGRVRTLKTARGETIVERLLSFDEAERRYSYAIVQGPFPVRDYRASLQVRSLPGNHACVVDWSGSFVPEGIGEEEAIRLLQDIFFGGLDALRKSFSAAL